MPTEALHCATLLKHVRKTELRNNPDEALVIRALQGWTARACAMCPECPRERALRFGPRGPRVGMFRMLRECSGTDTARAAPEHQK
jgi:hypothetical protein